MPRFLSDVLQTAQLIRRNRSLSFLTLGRALRSFGQSYLIVIVPLYLLARGASPAHVGIIVTIWTLGSALLGTAAGFAGDRYARKFVLLAFSALSFVAAFAFYADSPLWLLAIAGALGGIGRGGGIASGGGFGPFYSAEQALIAEHSPHQLRTRILAVFSLVGTLGGAAGLLLTGLPQLIIHEHLGNEQTGYHALFLITAVVAAALIAVTLPIREYPYGELTKPASPLPLAPGTRRLLGRFWITNSLNGLAIGFLGPMLVLWFHLRYGASSHEIGAIYFVMALTSAISFMFVGTAVRRFGGAIKTIVWLRLFSCALLAVMPLMPALWLAGLVYLVRMMFNSITMPVRQSYVMGIIPPEERARAASISNLPSQFLSMAGPGIAGVLLTETWIGTMLEAAAGLQLLNAFAYAKLFGSVRPPEERLD
jgi:MFS family permease